LAGVLGTERCLGRVDDLAADAGGCVGLHVGGILLREQSRLVRRAFLPFLHFVASAAVDRFAARDHAV